MSTTTKPPGDNSGARGEKTAALVVTPSGATVAWQDGSTEAIPLARLGARLGARRLVVCHLSGLTTVLEKAGQAAALAKAGDALELFAFVRPGCFCLPTVDGLIDALGLAPGAGEAAPETRPLMLLRAVRCLLAELRQPDYRDRRGAAAIAGWLGRAGWPWAAPVLTALGGVPDADPSLAVWGGLDDWDDYPPSAPAGDATVDEAAAQDRLRRLLGEKAEARLGQRDYTSRALEAFQPRQSAGAPNMVLGEAGTGVGKTLGYIAPASLWAEESGGTVWLSTYTKNLQRQIDKELDRLFPDAAEKAERVVVRKGRENYLCLLNFQEAVDRLTLAPGLLGGDSGPMPQAIVLGLIARWLLASRDGDMIGGDFPAWLMARNPAVARLTDRRGECVYTACAHYRKCFVERAVRKARHADIVIANHALVMVRAALGGDDSDLPARYVFDEGHHLFDAADSTFSSHLSGREMAELRRWIRGAEGRRRRGRGLEARLTDLTAGDDSLEADLRDALRAATALPADGWLMRIATAAAHGPAEHFLAAARSHVLARAANQGNGYSLEAEIGDPGDDLCRRGEALRRVLKAIGGPMGRLVGGLARRLDDDAATLDTPQRIRLEAAARGLAQRLDNSVRPWLAMLGDLGDRPPDGLVDWLALSRNDGQEFDVGLHRHWVDPTRPFAEAVLSPAHGVLVTSATLRDVTPAVDREPVEDPGWQAAEVRTGSLHMPVPARRFEIDSPFDYPGRTRIFIIGDVNRNDPAQVAAAFRELIVAAGGGAIGLFTAIRRLREVHGRIAPPLAAAGLPLYAQHVDPFDTGTLVDLFRAEENASLLGTDAIRDGIDVPGRSLRLLAFDRVPWPRPGILHRARRQHFGGRQYDEMLTRLKLKQAFGRLIRRMGDYGVFVMLDSALPSRLLGAFPPGVPVVRGGLAESLAAIRTFFATMEGSPPKIVP